MIFLQTCYVINWWRWLLSRWHFLSSAQLIGSASYPLSLNCDVLKMWSCSKYWFHKHIMFCKCDVALDIDSVFVTSIYHDIIFWKCNLVPNLDFRFINCLHWYKCFLKRISAQTSLPKCYSYYFTFHCMRYIYICSQSIVVLQLAARALYLSAKLFKTSETSNLISPPLCLNHDVLVNPETLI